MYVDASSVRLDKATRGGDHTGVSKWTVLLQLIIKKRGHVFFGTQCIKLTCWQL